MRKLVICSCAFTVWLGIGLTSMAQNNGSELAKLGDEIVDSLQAKKPEWRYERVIPMAGSEKVVIQQWSSEGRSVRIAIVSHNSQNDGAQAMRDLARDSQLRESLPDLGDEGFSWGRGTVSFRKGNFTINVSAVITSPALDVPRAAANLAEEHNLSKEFARLVADAMKDK